MDEEKDFILIEEYLDGRLGEEARSAFEQRMSENEELAEEVALYRELNGRLEDLPKKQALQKQWKKTIHASKEGDKVVPLYSAKRHGLGFYLLRIAAVIVVAVGLYFLIPWQPSPDQLAMNYWEKTAQFHYTGGEKSTDPTAAFLEQLNSAYDAYGQKDFAKTINLLDAIEPVSDEVILLKGAAYFQKADLEKAVQNFQSILNRPQSSAKEEAQWYLALSLLKKKEVGKAKGILQEIVNAQSWQYREAGELLKSLSGIKD